MLISISTISFVSYGVFILIAFGAFIVLYRFLKKEKLELEKIDRLVNFFKTVVYATAFSAVGFIIANLFQERKQIIVESEFFDKYTEYITQADDGEKRLLLSQYFSIVTPRSKMKTSWTNYYNELIKEREELRERKNRLEEIEKNIDKEPTLEQSKEMDEIHRQIERFETPLITKPIVEIFTNSYWQERFFKTFREGTWVVIVRSLGKISDDEAERITNELKRRYPNFHFELSYTVASDGKSNPMYAIYFGRGLSRTEAQEAVRIARRYGVAPDAYAYFITSK